MVHRMTIAKHIRFAQIVGEEEAINTKSRVGFSS